MDFLERNLKNFLERVKLIITLEKIGFDYYKKVAQKYKKELKNYPVLREILNSEGEHLKLWEELLKRKMEVEKECEMSEEYLEFLKLIIKQAIECFDVEKFNKFYEVIERALIFEKDILIIYQELLKLFKDEEVLNLIDKVLLEEKLHITKLIELKFGLIK